MRARTTAAAGAVAVASYQFLPEGLWWEGCGQFAVVVDATAELVWHQAD